MLSTADVPAWTLLLWVAVVALGCRQAPPWDGSLERFLRGRPEHFETVMDDPAYRLQIVYSQIDRDAQNRPLVRTYSYRSDPETYFYPASTVKLPVALLALEKLRRLEIAGLDRHTPMYTGAVLGSAQTEARNDDTSLSGLPTVGHYVRKIFLVSDNDAYNRLYELLGQAYLNDTLHERGFTGTRIVHRLSLALDPEANRHTNPVRFVDPTDPGRTLYEQPEAVAPDRYTAASPVLLGRAEIRDGQRIEGPKDFATKNAFPLREQHDLLLAFLFPEAVAPERRFHLSPEDERFVLEQMSAYPGESGIAAYQDADRYPEGYVKFLLYGGDAPRVPRNIRIFNKVGDAYGFLTDCAYVVDFENGVEFLLAATIHVNANGTFNDDTYEYDRVGFPFLRALGQAIYALERQRERPRPPDLSRFRLGRGP